MTGHRYYVAREPLDEYSSTLTESANPVKRDGRNVSVVYDYQNNSAQHLTVVNRQGLRVRIPPNPMGGDGTLIVKLTVMVDTNVILDIEDLFISDNPHDQQLAKIIKAGYDRIGGQRGHHHSIDFTIEVDAIGSKGGNVYYRNLDIVVSTLNKEHVAKHPATQAYHKELLITRNEAVNDTQSFGYSICIVDAKNRFGKRFININKQIYSVPVKIDPSLPDGVYCTSSGSVEGDVDYAIPTTKCYSFEEADSVLGMYRTVDEAKSYGDVFAQRERELKELTIRAKEEEHRIKQEKLQNDQELERRKLEIDNLKADHDSKIKHEREMRERETEQFKYDMERLKSEEKQRQETEKQQRERKAEEFKLDMERQRNEEERRRKQEIANHERRIERLKEEYAQLEHQRKIETLRYKEEYEQRSYKRKESSELIKFIPSLITGIFAIAMAAMKFFSSTAK